MNGKQLKNSILQSAIQGKLVPQDPNDEPASVLLERVRAEKERLIKEKKIKRPKNESVIFCGEDNSYYEKFADGTVKCIDDEIPFEIPNGWEWCRLGTICKYLHRGKSPKYSMIQKLPIIAQKCNQWDKLYIDRCQFSDVNFIEKYSVDQFIQVDDILINSTGGGTVGRTGIVNKAIFNLFPHFVADSHVTILRACEGVIRKYIYYYLVSPFIQVGMEDRCSGSTNQMELGTNTINNYLIPLPPCKEQERIVETINNISPSVEIYSKSQDKLNKLNTRIKVALKKSILQEAIQGKLVPQDPNDEPASVLLECIRAEKERLIKEKKIKRDRNESIIYKGDDNSYYERIGKSIRDITNELPFEIPNNWVWVRMENVISLLSGRDLEPTQYNSNNIGIPYITGASNFNEGKLIINRWTNKYVTVSHKGSLLITCKGTIGTMAFNNIGDIHIARQIMSINAYYISLEYLMYFLQYSIKYLEANANSIIPGISRDTVLKHLLPLPPLQEQQRIVIKIKKSVKNLK